MVMVAFGPEHLTVTMNGHEVQGWASVADYFMPPQATEFWSVKPDRPATHSTSARARVEGARSRSS